MDSSINPGTEPASPLTICLSRIFDAPPERVFDAWLDPAVAGRFLFATPTGTMTQVTIDARVGGLFTIVEHRNGVDAGHYGEYLEIDQPHRLVFRFAVNPKMQDATRVCIDIRPLAPNVCELTLTHDMDPRWADYKARTEQGWTSILAGLATALGENHAPA